MTAYDFHMSLVRDAIVHAETLNTVKVGTDYPHWLRPMHLAATRTWLDCAKKNLALAEAELTPAAPTLKPLRMRPLTTAAEGDQVIATPKGTQ